jgi:hypothetical protein
MQATLTAVTGGRKVDRCRGEGAPTLFTKHSKLATPTLRTANIADKAVGWGQLDFRFTAGQSISRLDQVRALRVQYLEFAPIFPIWSL